MLVLALLFLSTIVLLVAAVSQQEQSSQTTLVINGITIVDVERGTLQVNRTVIVAGDKIQRISKQGNADVPTSSTRIIDGRGLFLVPGLIDAHVHYSDPAMTCPHLVYHL